uniref:Fibrinogen-related protein n=1 Tax=Mytilus galloprovincialis TaxID=29158 RepID=E5KXF6_MYTGA|nr:fibrinogen-related protein [Mytilus galloprovincialis]
MIMTSLTLEIGVFLGILVVLVNSTSIQSNSGSYTRIPIDCGDIDIKRGSGVYMIYPTGSFDGFNVYCNMKVDNVGGGWTVFQRRLNGAVGFYRGWDDYKAGFGTLEEEHWLGNENLHILTSQAEYQLLITLQDFANHTGYAKYANFNIANEAAKYKMTCSSYKGNVGDSLARSIGQNFTTKDQDNDKFPQNCAVSFKGAWWYKECHDSNLNGQYLGGTHTSFADGVNWKAWKGYHYSLKATMMMIRRKK